IIAGIDDRLTMPSPEPRRCSACVPVANRLCYQPSAQWIGGQAERPLFDSVNPGFSVRQAAGAVAYARRLPCQGVLTRAARVYPAPHVATQQIEPSERPIRAAPAVISLFLQRRCGATWPRRGRTPVAAARPSKKCRQVTFCRPVVGASAARLAELR